MSTSVSPERADAQRALLRFLQRQEKISSDDVARLEGLLAESNITLHELLERERVISGKDLAILLANVLRLGIIDLTSYPLDPQVARILKENIATRYEIVPVRVENGLIEVATANPLDLDGLKAVEFATGKRVQALVATQVEVRDALAHAYKLQESLEQFLQHVPGEELITLTELQDQSADLRTIARDAELPPVIKLADLILIEGIKSRASDVHVEPGTDALAIRYRIDGMLEESFRFPKWVQSPLTARLKVMAKLDITERRVPQDGRIQLRYQDKLVDLRVSSLPAQHGEKITLRILDPSSAVQALSRVGLSGADLQIVREEGRRPQGMILLTGPTGSGKTTTLYALLREVFSPNINIVTIENPIEYQLRGINQVGINEKQGLGFAEVLRSVLRQDPDVILIGEIRDAETAHIAFQAAQTGHLVLSTVHTNDAVGAVNRLIDLGLEPFAVAAALNLVVAQRLVRRVCVSCSEPDLPPEDVRRALQVPDDGTIEFRHGRGCPACRQSGYAGRLGVYELLPISPTLAKLIESGASESALRQRARAEGRPSILEDALDKVKAGVTTAEELLRVVQVREAHLHCPACNRQVNEEYTVCPHCSHVLRAICPACAKPVSADWARCPFCGTATATVPGEVETAETSDAAAARSYKALVVDDTATILEAVRGALERSDLGLGVETVASGAAALERVAHERPDVVILDIEMPEMDGFEVCRRLRSDVRTAFLPILMLTSHGSDEFVERGFGVGVDDYIVKPFRREDLVARVRRMLERTYGRQAVEARAAARVAPSAAAPVREAGVADSALAELRESVGRLLADRSRFEGMIRGCEERVAALAGGTELAGAGGLARELAEVRRLLDEMRDQHARELADARAAAERARETAERAEARLAEARGPAAPGPEVGKVEAALAQLRREHGALAAEVTRRVAAAAQGSEPDEECERRVRELTARLEAEEAARADAGAQAQRALAEATSLRGALAEIESWRGAVAEVEGLRTAVAQLEELRVAVAEVEDLRAAMNGLREAQAASTAEALDHGAAVRAAVADIDDLRVTTGELREAQARVREDVQATAERLQAALLEDLRTTDARAEERWREQEGAVSDALRGLEELRESQVGLAARLAEGLAALGEAHTQECEARVGAVAQRLDRGEGERSDSEGALTAISGELHALAERMHELEVRIDAERRAQEEAVAAERAERAAERDAARRLVTELHQGLDGLRAEMRAVAAEIADLYATRERERRREDAVMRTAMVETYRRLAGEDAGQLDQAQRALDQVRGEQAQLRREIDTLRGVQGRLESGIEQKLDGVVRTAAGDFASELAHLRGELVQLASSVPKPRPSAGDAILAGPRAIFDRLEHEVAAIRAGAPWGTGIPRVLSLLVESTPVGAVGPTLRRILGMTGFATDAPARDADPQPRAVTERPADEESSALLPPESA